MSFKQSGSYGRAPRQMFDIICEKCGKRAQVPFEPTQGRPVYCQECYREIREKGLKY